MTFKDHFSGHAADYAQYRPRYPNELFEYLASVAPRRDLAWDCATGNGQAAVELGEFFEGVIATDASAKQIAKATQHPRVEYRVATAEGSGLTNGSIALIMVAQALHWFDLAKFFAETKRVLQPSGILAASCYELFSVSPEIDCAVDKFYRETVGPYWDFERTLVETRYATIDFPFTKVSAPQFQMKANWSLEHALGYLRTWSATKRFIAARGFDPVDSLGKELRDLWTGTRDVEWPLTLVVRRKED